MKNKTGPTMAKGASPSAGNPVSISLSSFYSSILGFFLLFLSWSCKSSVKQFFCLNKFKKFQKEKNSAMCGKKSECFQKWDRELCQFHLHHLAGWEIQRAVQQQPSYKDLFFTRLALFLCFSLFLFYTKIGHFYLFTSEFIQ